MVPGPQYLHDGGLLPAAVGVWRRPLCGRCSGRYAATLQHGAPGARACSRPAACGGASSSSRAAASRAATSWVARRCISTLCSCNRAATNRATASRAATSRAAASVDRRLCSLYTACQPRYFNLFLAPYYGTLFPCFIPPLYPATLFQCFILPLIPHLLLAPTFAYAAAHSYLPA